MKRSFLPFMLMICALTPVSAQKVSGKRTIPDASVFRQLDLKTIQLIDHPKNASGVDMLWADRCCHLNHLILTTCISKSVFSPSVRRMEPLTYLPAYQPKQIYSRDDLMKLPAANTNEMIRLLDTDRRFTHW